MYGDGFKQGGDGDRLLVDGAQFAGSPYGFKTKDARQCFDTCHAQDDCEQAVFEQHTEKCFLMRHAYTGVAADERYMSLGCFSGTCEEMVSSAYEEVMCRAPTEAEKTEKVQDCRGGMLSKAQLVMFLRGSEVYQQDVGKYSQECSKS